MTSYSTDTTGTCMYELQWYVLFFCKTDLWGRLGDECVELDSINMDSPRN